MRRSIGVLLSVILVFFGCGMALLFGALMAFGFAMVPAGQASASAARVLLVLDCVFTVVFAGWGIATALGLLGLRSWARISMLVFSGLLAVFSFFPMVIMPFVPVPQSPTLPPNFGLLFHVGFVIFYGCFFALGLFWLVYFNQRSVKAQFEPAATVPAAPPAAFGFGVPVQKVSAGPKRPVLITVWSWFLIVSFLFAPFVFVLHTPAFLFGRTLVGRPGELWTLCLGAAGLAAGIGMLKLRWWAWALSLCIQLLALLNTISMMVIPGSMARLLAAARLQQRSMGLPEASTALPPLLLEAGVGFGMVFAIAIVVMLVVYRGAFSGEITTPSAAI
jgi:hypothetical protein